MERVVGDWQRGVRTVCYDEATGVRVREYVQRNFQFKPQIVHYENVDVEYFNGAVLSNPCPKDSTYLEEERGNVVPPWAQGGDGGTGRAAYAHRVVRHAAAADNRTFVRIKRFDVYNSYEAFHAYLNTFFLLRVLRLDPTSVQFVFTDTRRGDSPRDEMWWRSMNGGRHPIVFSNNNGQRNVGVVDGVPYRVRSMVTASSSGTSMLTSKHGALRGRRRDHHCSSPAFQEAVGWFRENFRVHNNISYSLQRPRRRMLSSAAAKANTTNSEVVRVLWSSRRPYQRGGVIKAVHRQLPREEDFIAALQRLLSSMGATATPPSSSASPLPPRSSSSFVVESIDFGAIDPQVAVEAASNADVLVGVHGAGLVWSAFMPRHGGLVELFGGNRGATNRHYHNLASLADLHYRSHTLSAASATSANTPLGSRRQRSSSSSIGWRGRDVHAVARLILGIPLYRE